MRFIAVINQKGGVGKTTTTVNLGHALAMAGHKVTVMDMDPQGHLSKSLGVDHRRAPGMDRILLDGASVAEMKQTVRENLTLIPAGPRLAEVDLLTEGGAKRGWILKQAINGDLAQQEYALIDCPPSSNLLAMNSLLACNEVLVPVSGDYLSLDGLFRFMGVYEHIARALQKDTREWIVITRYNERRRMARGVRQKIQESYPGKILATPIRENVALAESPAIGKTIFEYQNTCKGADDYRQLAQDLMNNRTL